MCGFIIELLSYLRDTSIKGFKLQYQLPKRHAVFYDDSLHFELFLKIKYHQILQKNVKDECSSRWRHTAVYCQTQVAAISVAGHGCVNDTCWSVQYHVHDVT